MAVWLQVKVRGRGLHPLYLWHKMAAATAICGLCRYIGVIHFVLCLNHWKSL